MHCTGRHPFALSDAGQFQAEVNVGQFAAAVGEERQQVVIEVLKIQLLVLIGGAGESDHAAGGTLCEARQQQIGQKKVSQMVDAEAHAEAIVGPVQDAGHACTGSAASGKIKKQKNNSAFFPLQTHILVFSHITFLLRVLLQESLSIVIYCGPLTCIIDKDVKPLLFLEKTPAEGSDRL